MISEVQKLALENGEHLHVELLENGSKHWLIVTHGLGEHCGRHKYMQKIFSQYFNICLYDLRGHGQSSGKRAYINRFSQYVSDLDQVIHYLKDNFSMQDYVLFGHSMGGLVTASYMQNRVKPGLYPKKVFLSGPAVAGTGALGKVFDMLPLGVMSSLASLPTSMALQGVLDLSRLSHDPRVYETYVTDKLNSLKVHSKTFLEILHEGKRVFSRPLRISCPLYCAVGTEDGLVNPEAIIEYFTKVEKNCNLYQAEGAYHEIHNEIEKYREPYFEFLRKSIMDSVFDDQAI